MFVKTKLLSTAAVIAVMSTPSGLAYAEDAADNDEFSLEEIVVTARKREENIMDAPLAISAFTSNMIEASGLKDLADVAKFTPGFSFDDEFGRISSDRPVIRGQSTILGASGVSTFIDGVLLTGTSLDYDFNDIERIEVIKGPQSAMYGRNTYSGAINIITKSPDDEFSGRVKGEIAEFDQYDISASVSGPLSETISGRLTARHFQRGGPFLNTYDNTEVGQQESSSIAGVLYIQPNERLDIRARLRWSRLDDDQPRLFTTDLEDNNCIGPDNGGTYLGNFRYFCGEIVNRDMSIDDVRLLDQKGFDTSETWESSISVNYELTEELTLTWINGYTDSSSVSLGDFGYSDGSLNPFSVHLGPLFGPGSNIYVVSGPVTDFASASEGNGWDFSSEIRLAYDTDDWHALIGGYYFKSRSNSVGTREAPSGFAAIVEDAYNDHIALMQAQCPTCFFHFNFGDDLEDLTMSGFRGTNKTKRENAAIFGSLEREIVDKLTVSAEARYSWERVTSFSSVEEALYDYQGTLLGLDHDRDGIPDSTVNSTTRQATFNSVNPRFTARYEVSDDVNLYAVVARGTKPGGFNNVELEVLGLDTYEEESVWSFEAGAKASFMDGRGTFNLALYHNTISGYQLTQSVVIPTLNETTTAIDNAGKVRVKGLEAELTLLPEAVPGLRLNASYAYADSNFLEGDDINEGRHLDLEDDGSINCSLGFVGDSCNTTDYNGTPGSIVDKALPRAPKHMINIGASYSRPISDDWSLLLNANLSYESKKFVQVHNLAWTGSSTVVNASIGFENDQIRLVIWGKNLTDEDSVVSASRFADETRSFSRIFMGNPRLSRQFGVTGTVKF